MKNSVTGLMKFGSVRKKREEHREGLTEVKHRDGLSSVEQGRVQNINNIEKQRRYL